MKLCVQSERKLSEETVKLAQQYSRHKRDVLHTTFDSQDSLDEHRQDVRSYEMSQSMRTSQDDFCNEMEKRI